jgi:hypothetical protein
MARKESKQNRRHFFTALIRGGILASLTILSGALIRRWSESADCPHNFTCGNCDLSNRCELPEADSHRLEKAMLDKADKIDGRTGKQL